MTTGREALAEAARLETARVYGRLCKEHPEPVDSGVETPRRPVQDTGRHRESAAVTPDSGRVAELRHHYFGREAV